MADWYIFREPKRNVMKYQGFVNDYSNRKEKEDYMNMVRKKYPFDTVWAMKVVKGMGPLKHKPVKQIDVRARMEKELRQK